MMYTLNMRLQPTVPQVELGFINPIINQQLYIYNKTGRKPTWQANWGMGWYPYILPSGKLTVCYWKWPVIVDLPIEFSGFT